MNKLTAEKFLKKKKYPSFNNSGGLGKYYVEEAMVEFAQLHVEKALKAASELANVESILYSYPKEQIK